MEISAFFEARKRDIFHYLYMYVNGHIVYELFLKQMHDLNIKYQDYQAVGTKLVTKYCYRRKRKVPTEGYKWSYMPQTFEEYFATIASLRSYAKDNMKILDIVVQNLLEQYRDSFKYFLLKMFE
jgi:hypothetical protein